MESVVCRRISLSPFNPKSEVTSWTLLRYVLSNVGHSFSPFRGAYPNQSIFMTMSATGPGKGSGLLERPTIEKTTPGRESEFSLRKSKKTAPPYRVILHNDNYNKREYVVQVLMKVIPGMTLDNAVNIMQEAHYNGLAVVIICAQADAEQHCMQLRGNEYPGQSYRQNLSSQHSHRKANGDTQEISHHLHIAPSRGTSSDRSTEFQFDKLQELDGQVDSSRLKRVFGRYVAREAILDEDYWVNKTRN